MIFFYKCIPSGKRHPFDKSLLSCIISLSSGVISMSSCVISLPSEVIFCPHVSFPCLQESMVGPTATTGSGPTQPFPKGSTTLHKMLCLATPHPGVGATIVTTNQWAGAGVAVIPVVGLLYTTAGRVVFAAGSTALQDYIIRRICLLGKSANHS